MSWLEIEDEVRYGTCRVCGWEADGPCQLDDYGTCSVGCSETYLREYMARGVGGLPALQELSASQEVRGVSGNVRRRRKGPVMAGSPCRNEGDPWWKLRSLASERS